MGRPSCPFYLSFGVALALLGCGRTITPVALVDVLIPNDPRFPELWGMRSIQLLSADANHDCRAIPVAIIDTGITPGHEDLAANLWTNPGETAANAIDDDANGVIDDVHGANFIPATADDTIADDNLHGTHVSGTIGAVAGNGVGVAGICFQASLMGIKALDAAGSGTFVDIAEGLDYARLNGARVVNMSLGALTTSATGIHALLDQAVTDAETAGVLIAAAAGNEANDNDASYHSYPAYYSALNSNVLSVAAITKGDELAVFSNFGASSTQIAAPGKKILSTFPTTPTAEMTSLGKTSSYEEIDGTSMACPHVAGVATLLLARNPAWSMGTLKGAILALARPLEGISTKVAGGGRVLKVRSP